MKRTVFFYLCTSDDDDDNGIFITQTVKEECSSVLNNSMSVDKTFNFNLGEVESPEQTTSPDIDYDKLATLPDL